MNRILYRAMSVAIATLLLAGCGNTPATEPASPSSSSIIVVPETSSVPAVSDNPSTPDIPASEAASEPLSKPASEPKDEDQYITYPSLGWWQEIFRCESTPIMLRNLYLHDNAHKLSYHSTNYYQPIVDAIMSAIDTDDLGKRVRPDHYVELVMDSDDKYTVTFWEKGIELTYSHWKLDDKNTVKLAVPTAEYDALMLQMDGMLNNIYPPNAMWLSMMNRGRIRSITVTDSKGKNASYSTEERPDMLYLIEPYIRSIEVRGEATVIKAAAADPDYTVDVTFNNNVTYKITVKNARLAISSSDVQDVVLDYDLASPEKARADLQAIVDHKINPNTPNYDYTFTPSEATVNPETGKPVIYLYPTKPTDCTVTVDYDSFTYTYPTYNGGWNVTAYPDGRLVNKADGSEHYYLFWEGNKRVDWQFDSGFVVAGSDTESFLREKLAYMGLTPREYNDFITYWVPRMQDNRYNLITFAGEQYEQLAPLTVTPAPDSILRVHMVYKAIDAPVTIPAQTLTQFTRKGFTVVEWGGSVTG